MSTCRKKTKGMRPSGMSGLGEGMSRNGWRDKPADGLAGAIRMDKKKERTEALSCNPKQPNRLALGKLEPGARATLTVFLALLGPGVALDEACFFERTAKIRVGLDKRAGDTVPNGAGLP